MWQKLQVPTPTCLRVLNEDLGFRKSYLKLIPHSMKENEAHCHVIFSEELLQVVRHAKGTQFDHL
jgi:hypothetical protein